jgi:hypothetical protein
MLEKNIKIKDLLHKYIPDFQEDLFDDYENITNQLIGYLAEGSLAKLNKINSGLAGLEKGEALAARSSLGINDDWTYTNNTTSTKRGAIKSLVSGYLFIEQNRLFRQPEKTLNIWDYYISMYIPNFNTATKYEGFYPHISNIHLYNFHHFIIYQRFLLVNNSQVKVSKFKKFYKDYLYEMLLDLSDNVLTTVNEILEVEELKNLVSANDLASAEKSIAYFEKTKANRNQVVLNNRKYICEEENLNKELLGDEKYAFFYGEEFRSFPDNTFENTDLEQIVVYNTNIREIPDEIKKMHNLKKFHISGSEIKYLSPEIFKLPGIQEIDIIDPKFQSNEELSNAIGLFMARNNLFSSDNRCPNPKIWEQRNNTK